jgi:LPS-assembly lipoprotein
MSWSERRRRALAATAAAGLAGAGLAGCGFALRRPPELGFGSIALAGFAPRSPLAEALRRGLVQRTRVLEDAARAEVVLYALEDRRDRAVVASTAAAQVREIQLRLRFDFRVATPAGRELTPRVQIALARDMTYTETAALAKEVEEAEFFRAMQDDVVEQVLRRLAAIRL